MVKLAIHGGNPVLGNPLPPYNSIGNEELEAVIKVVKSGCLSGFYGSWGDHFLGGPAVRAFEENWSKKFKAKYAVSVNSASSALLIALGAINISPGDEVILPPYTMSATAMSPLVYGGIPVFVDIEPETFCLDIEAVKRSITSRTKAILAVNLFGHPAKLIELKAVSKEKGIILIEDNAQGPLAMEDGRYAGTIGDIGVFSLNYHKHIHTGEGGICVTNNEDLALRMQLIRNHAENIVLPLGIQNITNLVGFNLRMTELSAAVGIEQLKKIEYHVEKRVKLANYLTEGLKDLEGITVPTVRNGCHHVYYVWAVRYDEELVGISREVFCKALEAEGFPNFTGYTMPLYMLPIFQRRIAIGSEGFPFNLTSVRYEKGMCPVVERMWSKEFLGFEICAYDITDTNLDLLVQAFRKVYSQRLSLSGL